MNSKLSHVFGAKRVAQFRECLRKILHYATCFSCPFNEKNNLCDFRYVSYSEVEIQCRGEDNTNYNVLQDLKHVGTDLVGVFNDAYGRNSAICVFNMSKIRLTFWYNIDRCWSGTDSIGLSHIGRDSKCINVSSFFDER
jgi:hypothetical protein